LDTSASAADEALHAVHQQKLTMHSLLSRPCKLTKQNQSLHHGFQLCTKSSLAVGEDSGLLSAQLMVVTAAVEDSYMCQMLLSRVKQLLSYPGDAL
jgi:hypothetical protein